MQISCYNLCLPSLTVTMEGAVSHRSQSFQHRFVPFLPLPSRPRIPFKVKAMPTLCEFGSYCFSLQVYQGYWFRP